MARDTLPKNKLEAFDFEEGTLIQGHYEILKKIGHGWEGEVYLVKELATGIEKAIKFFYPHRNIKGQASKKYALKLHKLRNCSSLIQYHTSERFYFLDFPVTMLVSEYVEGEIMGDFIKRQPGKKLPPYEALHFLYALAKAIEEIHIQREYHGDLHIDNIILTKFGLTFQMKILDLFHWHGPRPENIRDDVVNCIRIFYDVLGGEKHYARHPKVVKDICCGLKRSLITKKFKNATRLRIYLENLDWES